MVNKQFSLCLMCNIMHLVTLYTIPDFKVYHQSKGLSVQMFISQSWWMTSSNLLCKELWRMNIAKLKLTQRIHTKFMHWIIGFNHESGNKGVINKTFSLHSGWVEIFHIQFFCKCKCYCWVWRMIHKTLLLYYGKHYQKLGDLTRQIMKEINGPSVLLSKEADVWLNLSMQNYGNVQMLGLLPILFRKLSWKLNTLCHIDLF